jgi:phage-related protein
MKSYTAFKGIKFSIEWYVDHRGYSQPFEYFEKSSKLQQDKTLALFEFMANHGRIFNREKFNNEGDDIYAFKINQDRYICFFFKGGKIVVTNAFIKKSQKMPSKEKERALRALDDYIKRVQEGTYYEEEN